MVVEALQGFWIELAPILLQMVSRSAELFYAPIQHPELLWVLVPVYINWALSDFMSTNVSLSNAASTGFTYLWVGTSWLKEYFQHLEVGLSFIADNISINISKFLAVANPLELAIVGFMFFYGLVTMWFALRGKEVSKFMGDMRTEAFLLIVFTPVLFRIVPFDIVTITSMVFAALVFHVVIEIIYRIVHPDKVKRTKD